MADTSDGVEYEKGKSRRGYTSIDAVDPHDGKTWQVLVSDEKARRHVAGKGKGAVQELADTVCWSVMHPRHIYRGVRNEQPEIDETEWLCYVSQPPHAWDFKRSKQVPPWPGEVFLVFVTDERVVYHWCWAKCDPRDPSKPMGFDQRFSEQVL